MQKNVLSALLVLAIIAVGIFFLMKDRAATVLPSEQASDAIPEVSSDILWNAYTLNDLVFIYPSDWTLEEEKTGASVTGFTVTYPISSNSFDKITAGGQCPEAAVPEMESACIGGIWLRTESKNPVVIRVFEDMKKFGENSAAKI
ncbi:MAG TPA: hypothetical protein PK950_00475 [Candidatus Paceibacterota bacterium]|nr:hypothetical protein [Candidatus Paceibacterota bacterium]